MFTSCGWFFDEISGLETVQCLQYAGRALSLARQFNRDFEPAFVEGLAAAPSNIPRFGDGAGVWNQAVRPAVVDLDRVLAHHAISLIYRSDGEEVQDRVYSYDVEILDQEIRSRGNGHLAVGRLRAGSRRTRNRGRELLRGHPLRRARLPRGPRPGHGAGRVPGVQAQAAGHLSRRLPGRRHEHGGQRVPGQGSPA